MATRTLASGATVTYIEPPKTPDMFVTTTAKPTLEPVAAAADTASVARVTALRNSSPDTIQSYETQSGMGIKNDNDLAKAEQITWDTQNNTSTQAQNVQAMVAANPLVAGQDPGFSIPSTDASLDYQDQVKVLQDKSLENQQWNAQKAKCPSFGCGLCTYNADTSGLTGALNQLDQSKYINDKLNAALASGNTNALTNLFNCVKYVNSSVMPQLAGGLGKVAEAGNSSAFGTIAGKMGYSNVPGLNDKLATLTSKVGTTSESLTQTQNIFTAAGMDPSTTVSSSLGSRMTAASAVDLTKLTAVTGSKSAGGGAALLSNSMGTQYKMAKTAASIIPAKAA